MTHVLCHYCKKPCRKFFDDLTRVDSWQCDYHGSVRVRMNKLDNGSDKVTLVILYKESTYHAIYTYNHPDPNTIKFSINKVNRRPKTHETVMSLDFYPDLTPENIESKLPTMILFS